MSIEIPVIYEDKNFIAVNKPSGLLVHGVPAGGKSPQSKTSLLRGRQMANREATLADWLRKHYPETSSVGDDPHMRPGIVHRLDKETSGVLIVARNQKSFEYLKMLFQKREIQKIYLALVWGAPKNKTGVIDTPIGMREGTLRRSIHAERMKKEARTEYRVKRELERDGQAFSLLEVFPKTGRTHQIRVHLASIGHPIVGDRLYGGKAQGTYHVSRITSHVLPVACHMSQNRLMLHAASIEFTKQDGGRIRIEAELPKEFADLYSL